VCWIKSVITSQLKGFSKLKSIRQICEREYIIGVNFDFHCKWPVFVQPCFLHVVQYFYYFTLWNRQIYTYFTLAQWPLWHFLILISLCCYISCALKTVFVVSICFATDPLSYSGVEPIKVCHLVFVILLCLLLANYLVELVTCWLLMTSVTNNFWVLWMHWLAVIFDTKSFFKPARPTVTVLAA